MSKEIEQKRWDVISLGGSLIFPDSGLDVEFTQAFRSLILSSINEGRRFIIIAGGGSIARLYQRAITDIANTPDDAVDEIGISALRTNAHFLRLAFEDKAYPKTIDETTEVTDEMKQYPIIVGGAANPGKSTDFNAVCLAERVGATAVINLSNVDHVYNADPNHDSDARALDDITWDAYRDIIPKDFSPGLSTPFDPVAAKKAQSLDLKVLIMNGETKNLSAYLAGDKFEGTTIHP